ncbi:hypothetical protein BV898_01647 [Hypsibius exemplaris]|uniref:Uncharacterized protein n=1 Tax=Hypsibius exemplaris TaxID=2072580 RepID=A0A1W0XAP4_HYPEX|nr:hypothetical protein BV898_01647 [Hypsibius exemplaris]
MPRQQQNNCQYFRYYSCRLRRASGWKTRSTHPSPIIFCVATKDRFECSDVMPGCPLSGAAQRLVGKLVLMMRPPMMSSLSRSYSRQMDDGYVRRHGLGLELGDGRWRTDAELSAESATLSDSFFLSIANILPTTPVDLMSADER